MASLLLVVIYVAFISLGLPDSVLGSAWPSMYTVMGVTMSSAGIITAICSAGTMISSLFSEKVIHKLGTGLTTTISVAMTALGLFGYSISGSFLALCLWSIPYGLGAGSVDAALNNFVAIHYKSRHMSWLHCFWGIGASLGPAIMGLCLTNGLTWNSGYQAISVIQVALVAVLVFSLPLWKTKATPVQTAEDKTARVSMRKAFTLPGAKQTLTAFFCYCSMEATAGFWASSYMVVFRGIAPETAALMASVFYIGITAGRFISGFATMKLDNRHMVRIGQGIALVGVLLLILPFGNAFLFAGLTCIGLGCAPIYPSLIHETPRNFGKERSQMLIGLQMATAYTGTTLMPPLFGLIAQYVNIALYPFYLLVFVILMIFMTESAGKLFDTERAKAAAE